MAEYNPSKIIKDGNTYNFRDTTKIPLAGSNAISGSLIPSADNAYDLGSNTYAFNSGTFKSVFGNKQDQALLIRATSSFGYGGFIEVCGKDDNSGRVRLVGMSDANRWCDLLVNADGTLIWWGQPIQYPSDQRLKQQIAEIDDKLLDAWQDVDLVQFKYNDAVDEKGDKARLHTGYVVQQIDNACKSHGVDVSQYGLYCHEEYAEETEEVEIEQADGTKTKERKVIREASEHYSLRYTEALIVECAYLRKKNKELQEQLDKLSARLDKLEGVQTK